MVNEEIYNNLLDTLAKKLSGTSDIVNVEIQSYSAFLTNNGQLHGNRQFFSFKVMVQNYGIPVIRFFAALGDTFTRITEWMNEWSSEIHFADIKANSISADRGTYEIEVRFDSVVDSAKRYLLK
jgi:hypothetical protein